MRLAPVVASITATESALAVINPPCGVDFFAHRSAGAQLTYTATVSGFMVAEKTKPLPACADRGFGI